MFKKKLILGLSLVMLLSVALTGCGAKETAAEAAPVENVVVSKVLNFNLGVDPNTLDPALNHSIDGSHIINNIYEGLTREIDGVLENAMAETIDLSEDGTVYTFHIRDAVWSDGEPVTANDFRYGWLRTLTPANGAPYAPHMFYIKNAQDFYDGKTDLSEVGIKVVNDKTFEVTLETPTPYFLSLITRGAFMPGREDIIGGLADGWAKDPEVVVSNGPFTLKKYSTADEIVLVKNDDYWNKDSVQLDEIICKMIVEASTALTAFDSGDFDIITKIPEQDKTRLMAADDRFHVLPMLGTYYMIFNVDVKPLDDVNVRKALALSIDRKLIAESVKKSGEIPATGFNPKGLKDSAGKDFNETAGDYGINVDGGNIEEAKEYLAKAGFPNGEGFPKLTLLYNTSESHKAVCETIQEMWKKNLGIDIELGNQEWAVFSDTRKSGDFEIARGGYIGDYPDPVGLLELMQTGQANNNAQWSNEKYDDLIDQSRYVKGTDRDALIYEAEKILMEDMPISPIYYYTDPVMVQNNISGWQKNSMSYWYFGVTDKE